MDDSGLTTADYDFALPRELIAQHPTAERDDSRLLVVDRTAGTLTHRRFRDLVELISAGDALVLNTSRVIKARLFGRRESGGEAEILLLERREDGSWTALVRPGAKLKSGSRVSIAPGAAAVVLDALDNGARVVRFDASLNADEIIEQFGHIPLPPYIDRADTPADFDRYQTVYAREPGSVAAPTAGLHFTPGMLESLSAKGVHRAEVTLHVGAGTFKPVDGDDLSAHRMHREKYSVSAETAALLNATRAANARIWAVGTTSLRVLETVVDTEGCFRPAAGETDIFIRPPHTVRGADRLVTNFHLPRSTLLMLVAAFAGYELARRAYDVAIAEEYRFYSYGDAMCVI